MDMYPNQFFIKDFSDSKQKMLLKYQKKSLI